MSQWADYINECGILSILEQDFGWVTYHLDAPDVIINDMYVAPEHRKQGKGNSLVEHVAGYGREFSCNRILFAIHRASLSADGTEKAATRAGFKLQEETDRFKIFSKGI